MSLIEFRNNRGLVRQLTRIADALEEILRQQYGVALTPPKVDTSGPETEVLYTDEEQIAILERLDSLGVPPDKERRAELDRLRKELRRAGE